VHEALKENVWTGEFKETIGTTFASPLDAFRAAISNSEHGVRTQQDPQLTAALSELYVDLFLFAASTPSALAAKLIDVASNVPEILGASFGRLVYSPAVVEAFPVKLSTCHGNQLHTLVCGSTCSNFKASAFYLMYAYRGWLAWDTPLGTRVIDQEWALFEHGGGGVACNCECGCIGMEHLTDLKYNPLRVAIKNGDDETGAWLAARLPPGRLKQQKWAHLGFTALDELIGRRAPDGEPRPLLRKTIRALLDRLPDFDFHASTERRVEQFCPELLREVQTKRKQFHAGYMAEVHAFTEEALKHTEGFVGELRQLVRQYAGIRVEATTK
jgi:hypothetical protein